MATISSRRTDRGRTRYQVKVRLKGHPPQTATFDRKTDAERWAQQTEAAIREGRYFRTAEAKRRTLAAAIDRYIMDVLPGKRCRAKQESQLRWWKGQLGSYLLCDVTPALIAECRDKLRRGITPSKQPAGAATQVRYLAVLSHLFTIAMREWGWSEDNPVRKVRRPTEPRGRVRFLSDAERTALLASCRESTQPHLYPVVVLALATGARQGEILRLRWAHVDLGRRIAWLEETKNGERRALPLTVHILEVLGELAKVRRIDSDLLFPGGNGRVPASLRRAWEAALKEAKIEDFRFHDLRHTCASYLAMNGATPAEIAAVLGHRTLAMVKRYAHLSEPHVSGVVARMNERIFGPAGNRPEAHHGLAADYLTRSARTPRVIPNSAPG